MTPLLAITTPGEEEVRLGPLGPRLRAFNYGHLGEYPPQQPLWLNLKDEAGALQGGLRGFVVLHWLRVEILFVEAPWRGQGWGSRLLRAAEDEARVRGARQAGVETFDFQAPEFYRRQGYEQGSCLADYVDGHSLFFYRKKL
jgi:GNAT superfamily N-acetyltransferase